MYLLLATIYLVEVILNFQGRKSINFCHICIVLVYLVFGSLVILS